MIGNGPPTLLLPKGHRVVHLPEQFKYFDRFMVITWGHDPVVVSHSNLLLTINDALSHGPILVICYGEMDEGAQVIHIPFNDSTHPLFNHPSVVKLHEKLGLKHFSGYITLLNPYNNPNVTEDYDEWLVLDLHYGIPLFDNKLNHNILNLFRENNQGTYENLQQMLEKNRKLSVDLLDFIQKYQNLDIVDQQTSSALVTSQSEGYLIHSIAKKSNKTYGTSVVIHPTQCLLFQNGTIQIYDEFC
jgi:hypothetical protein